MWAARLTEGRLAGAARWAGRTAAGRLAVGTVVTSSRNRITGLAGEAAFFTLLSLPPLLLGLVGLLGYLAGALGADTLGQVRELILGGAGAVLSPRSVAEVVRPALDDVLGTGRAGVSAVGFVVALWSGSRALNVYIDAITVLYDLSGQRGVIRQRAMSVALYALGLVAGVALVPLLAVGPNVLVQLLPAADALIRWVYWPAVLLLSTLFLATLYALSVPVRTPWREHLPGAAVALLVWVGGSAGLRGYLALTIENSPLYGTLSAPIAVLLWVYVTALAVLVGAAVNAELDRLHPDRTTARTRAEATG
ncbi:YihY/virulence factor BrkB family protein [Saccharopolyspora cebuensis]|uniref:YihY/virulence factor BrkB family protein n=1 Tax=Saccharopolyspora cebuensis TaxID=418759 RepID=A0ABV4CI03_9PSEU